MGLDLKRGEFDGLKVRPCLNFALSWLKLL